MANQTQTQYPTLVRTGDMTSIIDGNDYDHVYRTLDQQRTEYVRRLILKKASEAIAKVVKCERWNKEQCTIAKLLIRQMTVGITPSESAILAVRPVQGMTPKQHARVNEVVAQRFATTCWMQRRVLETTVLPGMEETAYRINYNQAKKLFLAQG